MNLTNEVTAALATEGWIPKWAACTNAMRDDYGNTAAIHESHRDTVRIEFEHALGGVVETLDLNPAHGAARIAAVIVALAAPPD